MKALKKTFSFPRNFGNWRSASKRCTERVRGRAQNFCGDRYRQVPLSSLPLEGLLLLLLLLSSPALKEPTKIFIFRDEKIEEVSPVGEQ